MKNIFAKMLIVGFLLLSGSLAFPIDSSKLDTGAPYPCIPTTSQTCPV